MGIIDSTVLGLTNLNPTTSTLMGGPLAEITTLGTTTAIGPKLLISKDDEGNKYFDPKKVSTGLVTTSTLTTTSNWPSNTTIDAYQKAASEMQVSEEQLEGVNALRDVDEWFESLSDEQQEAILASIDQKEQELQNIQATEKAPTKHL